MGDDLFETNLWSSESRGTVPLKPSNVGGGIALSQDDSILDDKFTINKVRVRLRETNRFTKEEGR